MPESKAVPRKSRADTGGEKVIEIPPAELHSFKNHPFKVKDDDSSMIYASYRIIRDCPTLWPHNRFCGGW